MKTQLIALGVVVVLIASAFGVGFWRGVKSLDDTPTNIETEAQVVTNYITKVRTKYEYVPITDANAPCAEYIEKYNALYTDSTNLVASLEMLTVKHRTLEKQIEAERRKAKLRPSLFVGAGYFSDRWDGGSTKFPIGLTVGFDCFHVGVFASASAHGWSAGLYYRF